MDHAYLESTVAPALTDALTALTTTLAPTFSAGHRSHPTLDPVDFIAKYLLRNLASTPLTDPADDRRAAARDAVLLRAMDDRLRAQKSADDAARAEAAEAARAKVQASDAAAAAAGGSSVPGTAPNAGEEGGEGDSALAGPEGATDDAAAPAGGDGEGGDAANPDTAAPEDGSGDGGAAGDQVPGIEEPVVAEDAPAE
ncbi:hypothetical protein H9P43_007028 [Blastocladiella emersonii ATCC 22665]|nr:hypothetical protein H9P43_007028 [Blastocladiella emersonii ATCC 22665]